MKKRMERVELHCHSKYSRYDSVISPYEMLTYADSIEMPAVAIMDCASILGFPDMERYSSMEECNVKPIYGMDACVSMDDTSGDSFFCISILVRNDVGRKNLYELITRSELEKMGYPLSLKVDATMANGASSVARTLNAPMFQRGGFFL